MPDLSPGDRVLWRGLTASVVEVSKDRATLVVTAPLGELSPAPPLRFMQPRETPEEVRPPYETRNHP